jgi:hypothetical protein
MIPAVQEMHPQFHNIYFFSKYNCHKNAMIGKKEIKDTHQTHTSKDIYTPGSFPQGGEKPQLFVSMCTGNF